MVSILKPDCWVDKLCWDCCVWNVSYIWNCYSIIMIVLCYIVVFLYICWNQAFKQVEPSYYTAGIHICSVQFWVFDLFYSILTGHLMGETLYVTVVNKEKLEACNLLQNERTWGHMIIMYDNWNGYEYDNNKNIQIFQYVTQLTEHLELIHLQLHRNFQSCGLPCTSLQLQKLTHSTSGK